jgi:hypothetical protein
MEQSRVSLFLGYRIHRDTQITTEMAEDDVESAPLLQTITPMGNKQSLNDHWRTFNTRLRYYVPVVSLVDVDWLVAQVQIS